MMHDLEEILKEIRELEEQAEGLGIAIPKGVSTITNYLKRLFEKLNDIKNDATYIKTIYILLGEFFEMLIESVEKRGGDTEEARKLKKLFVMVLKRFRAELTNLKRDFLKDEQK